jgi:riboflavin biosynthesis pyrimidine reductase
MLPMSANSFRPETTLLLSLSVDGRITSHDSDTFDPDLNWKNTPSIQAILSQFYDFNKPGLTALTTGVFMKSLGVNTRQGTPKKENLNLVVLDPDADLTPHGVNYLSQNVKKLFFVALNTHPLFDRSCRDPRIFGAQPDARHLVAGSRAPQNSNPERPTSNESENISYKSEIDLDHLFHTLYQKRKIKSLLIHSIAPLNATLLDAGLIDHLSIIISPLLVGNHGTPALLDKVNISIHSLTLKNVQSFSDDYINLQYDVNN